MLIGSNLSIAVSFHVTDHSLSLRDVTAESQFRNLGAVANVEPERNTAYWLVSPGSLSTFLTCRLGPPAQGRHCPG